jgi:hypothetical protein
LGSLGRSRPGTDSREPAAACRLEISTFQIQEDDNMNKMLAILGAGALLLAGCVGPESKDTGTSSVKHDAKVPGTDYHATTNIPCSMGGGAPTGSCPAGVKREGYGSAMVTVTKPDGRTRTIFFANGRATGYDQSQADSGRFSASRQGDLNIIRIGQERYEIPDALPFGG